MIGNNPVSWLAQYVFMNLYVHLQTCLKLPTGWYKIKTISNQIPEVYIFDTYLIASSREQKCMGML